MKKDFRVIIAGGRDFNDYNNLKIFCDKVLKNKKDSNIIILSGTARGADKLGEKYAKVKKYEIEMYYPDWDGFGKIAGIKRNETMGNNADALIAFWNGISKGTKHMIGYAKSKNLPVRIFYYNSQE